MTTFNFANTIANSYEIPPPFLTVKNSLRLVIILAHSFVPSTETVVTKAQHLGLWVTSARNGSSLCL